MKSGQYLILTLVLLSCNVVQDSEKDSITSGNLRLGADLSYAILAEAQTFAYSHLNKYAHIETRFAPEVELFGLLLRDSIQSAINRQTFE